MELIEHVLCALNTCTKTMRPDDAIWDDLYDKPYCSKQHKRLDKDIKIASRRDFEDRVLKGAVQ